MAKATTTALPEAQNNPLPDEQPPVTPLVDGASITPVVPTTDGPLGDGDTLDALADEAPRDATIEGLSDNPKVQQELREVIADNRLPEGITGDVIASGRPEDYFTAEDAQAPADLNDATALVITCDQLGGHFRGETVSVQTFKHEGVVDFDRLFRLGAVEIKGNDEA